MAQETSPHHPTRPSTATAGASISSSVRRLPRRWRIAAPLVAVVALALAAAACAPPGAPGGAATGDVVQAVNQERAAAGLGGLGWDEQLHGLAQSHANEIAASGSLWHSNLGAWLAAPWMSGWRSLGENLLVAPAGTSAGS